MYRFLRPLLLVSPWLLLAGNVFAQGVVLSPNGYSGLGLVPSASVLPAGTAAFSFDQTVAGAPAPVGYNYQLGLGLSEHVEVLGRLTTQDLKCNMFRAGACPPQTIRDFSASVKLGAEPAWLKPYGVSVAAGVTDLGGAANFFRSYYAVAGKAWGPLDLTLGYARSDGPYSPLDGALASVKWAPTSNTRLALERAGESTFAHALVQTPLPFGGVTAWAQISQRLAGPAVTNDRWLGFGVSFPLQQVDRRQGASAKTSRQGEVPVLAPASLPDAFKAHGFHQYRWGHRQNGTQVIMLENQAYDWDMLDAAGVAIGLVAGAFGHQQQDQLFELILTQRGLQQLRVKGEARCVRQWLEKESFCERLSVESMAQAGAMTSADSNEVQWQQSSGADFRPGILISPRMVNAIGTELGAFDMDLGANVALEWPLWPGATYETNAVKPLGINTRNYEFGHRFYLQRLYPTVNRRVLHQNLQYAPLNTQVRLSLGEYNTYWTGWQLHSRTVSGNGRHSGELLKGSFSQVSGERSFERDYHLLRYGYAFDDARTATAEVEAGQYWNGDKGYRFTQRFWHGDTAVGLFFRRTRMPAAVEAVSFAGIEVTLPITPRRNVGWKHLAIRGTSAWRHGFESKVLADDNIITGGHGIVPDLGESMLQVSNRGRNTTQYYQAHLWRLRSAYWDLRR